MAAEGRRDGLKAVKSTAELNNFEDVLELVGTTGPFDILVLVACSAVAFITPMQVLSAGFLGSTPPHWCSVQELHDANWTDVQIRELASPNNESCTVLDYNYTRAAQLGYGEALRDPGPVGSPGGNASCSHWLFQEGETTIVTEWELVCDRLVLQSTSVAAAHVGIFLGSLLFGYFLDRCGRRFITLLCIFLYVPCGMIVAASVHVGMYIAFRICVTAVGMGMYLGGFVLSMELCTPRQRSLVSSYYALPWAFGYMTTALIPFIVRHWRYLQVAYTVPATLLLLNYFILPESPRWLVQRGRQREALVVLKKMAARNKREMPGDEEMMSVLERIAPKSTASSTPCSLGSWLHTWVLPQCHVITGVVFFGWFSVSMVYYGVSQGASNLGMDETTFLLVGGALEVVSYLVVYPAIAHLGRRASLIITFAGTGAALLGVMGLQMNGYDGDNTVLASLSYIGKFLVTAAFQLVYIVAGELFPTRLRSLVLGEASVCARAGSISSPYINILLGASTRWAPAAFFGVVSCITGGLCLLLPETSNKGLDGGTKGAGEQGRGEEKQWGEQQDVSSAGRFNQAFELENKL